MGTDDDKPPPRGLNPRQQLILEQAQREGYVAIEDLARQFAMTPQTIRRDINLLSDAGLLRRHHGGAAAPSSVENQDYATRKVYRIREKRLIARLVARQIPNQASLFLDIGTTTEEVARALVHHSGLRVITNNLNVACILSDNRDCQVIIAGGVVRNRDRGVTGEATIDFVRGFKVDFGIIGVSGIDADGSLLEFDYKEVRVVQAVMENSRRVFLVADHSKFGRNALVRLGHVAQIDSLFTDRQPPESMVSMLAQNDTTLHVALHSLREINNFERDQVG